MRKDKKQERASTSTAEAPALTALATDFHKAATAFRDGLLAELDQMDPDLASKMRAELGSGAPQFVAIDLELARFHLRLNTIDGEGQVKPLIVIVGGKQAGPGARE